MVNTADCRAYLLHPGAPGQFLVGAGLSVLAAGDIGIAAMPFERAPLVAFGCLTLCIYAVSEWLRTFHSVLGDKPETPDHSEKWAKKRPIPEGIESLLSP